MIRFSRRYRALVLTVSLPALLAATPAMADTASAKPPASPIVTDEEDEGEPNDILVTARPSSQDRRAKSGSVVDTAFYDDVESIAADGNLAEQLSFLPGITTIDEGDAPRFVSIRGISPNLNHTTIDGIALASIGNDGEGSRSINLQLVPAEISHRTDIYKTFTPERDGGAIGGIVDIVTRSAFDRGGRYTHLDVFGSYSTFAGDDGRNAGNGSTPHWGGGAKGVLSDTFGPDGQFGIVLSGRYQSRVRNASKWWQETKYYFNDAGCRVAGPDAADWNGLVVPYNHSYGSYTNRLQTAGGSGKLEWQAPDRSLYASVMGFSYRLWESSTMNKNDFYTRNAVWNQTPEGGRSQVNSIYSRYRYDTWDKKTSGGIATFERRGDRSSLIVRGGYTFARYDNLQPYVGVRTYPTNLFLNWESGNEATGGIPRVVDLSDPSVVADAIYRLSTANITSRKARQGLATARIDYGWNAQASDRGFGFVTGVEYRDLDLRRDLDIQRYRLGRVMNDFLIDSGYVPAGAPTTFPWVDYKRARNELWPQLTLDARATAFDSAVSDYRYVERLFTPYLSLHHRWDNMTVISGVRYDEIDFEAYQPVVQGGVVLSELKRTEGGYRHLLPSLAVIRDVAPSTKLRLSYSRTLGRPTPGDIAQPETLTCGDAEDGGPECSIRRGNPELRPRRADNVDVQVERYFRRHGVIALGGFAKWISDDIFTLTSIRRIDDEDFVVRQPLNADNSRLYGLEFQVMDRQLPVLGREIDPFFNLTLLEGRTRFATDAGRRVIDRMLFQPRFIASGGTTVRLPEIDGAFRTTVNHRARFQAGIGDLAQNDTGRASQTTVNLSLWHQIAPRVRLKYDVVNLFNDQPKFLVGNRLQYVSEIDNYGRGFFFRLLVG